MKLRDIMTKNVVSVQPQSTVMDVAKAMQAHNIGSVPVCSQNNQVMGIVTDRDIVVRNLANDGDPKSTKVEALMSKNIVFGTPDMDVQQAAQLMAQQQIRRLPVMEGNMLVGYVALGDLATNSAVNEGAGQALSNISSPSQPQNLS